jgi:uncharacterized membrane protein
MKLKIILTFTIILSMSSYYSYQSGAATLDGQVDNDLKSSALTILKNKCNVCHRSQNPKKIFTSDNMESYATKIYRQVFIKRRMPKGDMIKLTADEEQLLKRWLKIQTPMIDKQRKNPN